LTATRRPDSASAATQPRAPDSVGGRRRDASLTAREREILGLLATGLSGAAIAADLVLSPETVRTHVRNAMAKLGASTRSQAVALALQRNEIADPGPDDDEGPRPASQSDKQRTRLGAPTPSFAAVHDQPATTAELDQIVGGLVSLHEIDAAAVYLTDEDGMTLRRLASGGEPAMALMTAPELLALGEGPIGRAALERRAQLVRLDHPAAAFVAQARSAVVAPMAAGRLVGVLCFSVRASRPAGRSELLLVQAFATRLAEVMTVNRTGGMPARFATALERFKASWTATTGA
jgi:DNA-binding CsgD family transcriptional regulator